MNQSLNSKVPRMSHAPLQTQVNTRPKPRGSEPPMHSAHIDRSTQSSKTAKSKESLSKYQSKVLKSDAPSKLGLNQRVLLPQTKEKNSLDKNSGSLNKIASINSPKAGMLSKGKAGNNTSMPGSSTTKISKPNNLMKVDSSSNLSNKSASSTNIKKGPVPQSPQTNKITSFQEISKMPRFSDLGLMPSDDEDQPIVKNGKLVTNGHRANGKSKEGKSVSKQSKGLSKESKKSSASNDSKSKITSSNKIGSNNSKLVLNSSVKTKQSSTNSKGVSGSSKNLSAEGLKLAPSKRVSNDGKIISNNSSKNQKIMTNNSVKSTKELKSGTKNLSNISGDKQGFKKKDPLISKNSSTIESRNFQPKFLRQSGFKHTDFDKIKELGSGKFGKVHLVKHITTGFVCALKTVPKALLKEQNIINQFIRELKIQSCLTHPNIAKLYGFFDDQQNIYLLMELGIQGQLYGIMKEKIKFNESTTIFIVRQLCQAVKYLHSLHILHRDIKPQNLVITYGTIKLCDFGWAVCKGSQLRSTFCGTPLYVSPQILKGQQYDEKIDVWAIGILTYELLMGDIPFQIKSQEQLVKIIKQEITFPPDIQLTTQAKDFIMKILKKNPEDRLKIQKLLQHPFLRRHIDSSDVQL